METGAEEIMLKQRLLLSALVCTIVVITPTASKAEETAAKSAVKTDIESEADKDVEKLLSKTRSEMAKIDGVDEATAGKFLRAMNSFYQVVAKSSNEMTKAHNEYSESDVLDFAKLKGVSPKLPVLKQWLGYTEAYSKAADAGLKTMSNISTTLREALEREQFSPHQVEEGVNGFLSKKDEFDKIKSSYKAFAKMANDANGIVKFLIKHEAKWSVDPEDETPISDEENFNEEFDRQLDVLVKDEEEINKIIESFN